MFQQPQAAAAREIALSMDLMREREVCLCVAEGHSIHFHVIGLLVILCHYCPSFYLKKKKNLHHSLSSHLWCRVAEGSMTMHRLCAVLDYVWVCVSRVTSSEQTHAM